MATIFAPALLAGTRRVGHDVDLRRHRIRAPDDDAVRLRHLARIRTDQPAGAGKVTRPGEVGADRIELPGIAPGVAQAVDQIALHETHRARVEIGPDGLAAVALLGLHERLGNRRRAHRPRRFPAIARRPSRPCGRAASTAGPDGRGVRRNGPPWRRSRRPCSCCPARRAGARPCRRRGSRRRARRSRGSRAGRRNVRSSDRT